MPNRWVQDDPSEEHPLLLEGGWPGPAAPSEHSRPVTKSEVDWQACTTQPPPAYAPTTHAFIAFMAGAAATLFAFMAFIAGAAAWPSSPAQLRPPSLPSWPSLLARPPASPSWPSSPVLLRPPSLPSWPSLLPRPPALPSWPSSLVLLRPPFSPSWPSWQAPLRPPFLPSWPSSAELPRPPS